MWGDEGGVYVTFANMADACTMQAEAFAHDIPGRLAPTPAGVEAGCGTSWAAQGGDADAIRAALAQYGIAHEGVFEIAGAQGRP